MPSFGYFTLTVHEARGLPQPTGLLIRRLDPFVIILIDNSPVINKSEPKEKRLSLERKTHTCKAEAAVWEETHVFRCNRGWQCRLELRDEGFISNSLLGTCDISVGEAKDGWYPLLNEDSEPAGEIRLSMDFRRDRGSMQMAVEALSAQSARGGAQVAVALADELRRIVRENRGKLTTETEDALLKVCGRFEKGPKSLLFVADVAKKMRELEPTSANSSASDDSCMLEFQELKSGLCDTVKADWSGFPGAPHMTEALLEKQFRIFDAENAGRLSPSAFSRFLSVVFVWGVQQCVAFSRLTLETGVGAQELQAIFKRWEPLDPDLSGSTEASNLRKLLFAMGDEYTDDEIALVLHEVDPASSGIVHFAEFVRWWAS